MKEGREECRRGGRNEGGEEGREEGLEERKERQTNSAHTYNKLLYIPILLFPSLSLSISLSIFVSMSVVCMYLNLHFHWSLENLLFILTPMVSQLEGNFPLQANRKKR
jgi:hypothetical protein